MTWRPKADEAFTRLLQLEVDATTQSPSILQFFIEEEEEEDQNILSQI